MCFYRQRKCHHIYWFCTLMEHHNDENMFSFSLKNVKDTLMDVWDATSYTSMDVRKVVLKTQLVFNDDRLKNEPFKVAIKKGFLV